MLQKIGTWETLVIHLSLSKSFYPMGIKCGAPSEFMLAQLSQKKFDWFIVLTLVFHCPEINGQDGFRGTVRWAPAMYFPTWQCGPHWWSCGVRYRRCGRGRSIIRGWGAHAFVCRKKTPHLYLHDSKIPLKFSNITELNTATLSKHRP